MDIKGFVKGARQIATGVCAGVFLSFGWATKANAQGNNDPDFEKLKKEMKDLGHGIRISFKHMPTNIVEIESKSKKYADSLKISLNKLLAEESLNPTSGKLDCIKNNTRFADSRSQDIVGDCELADEVGNRATIKDNKYQIIVTDGKNAYEVSGENADVAFMLSQGGNKGVGYDVFYSAAKEAIRNGGKIKELNPKTISLWKLMESTMNKYGK